MAEKLIDVYNRILKYNNAEVYIAFQDKTKEPYFHAKQLCKLLGYRKYHQALKINVEKRDIFSLKNIVKDYKILYKNVQGHTKFLNVPGMYSLILKSKKRDATLVFSWVTHDVLPSLQKYGVYKLTEKEQKYIDELNDKLEEYIVDLYQSLKLMVSIHHILSLYLSTIKHDTL